VGLPARRLAEATPRVITRVRSCMVYLLVLFLLERRGYSRSSGGRRRDSRGDASRQRREETRGDEGETGWK